MKTVLFLLGGLSGCAPIDEERAPTVLVEAAELGELEASAADSATTASALEEWAGDAQVVAVLDIVTATSYEDAGELRTEVLLRVVEVVRGSDRISEDEQMLVDISGGTLGTTSIVSSEAPLVFEDDRVLARLRTGDEGLTFDGNRSVIPVRDREIVACTNPASDAVRACTAKGAALIFSRGGERHAFADEATAIDLSLVRSSIY